MPDQPDLAKTMAAVAQDAVAHARNMHGVTLDFSADSASSKGRSGTFSIDFTPKSPRRPIRSMRLAAFHSFHIASVW
jgi:hypothetical protein